MHSKLLTARGLLEIAAPVVLYTFSFLTVYILGGIFYGKNTDQCLMASDAIGFAMDLIFFEAPASRFVSIWHRFRLARIGIQPATPGFGSFRYHYKSKR